MWYETLHQWARDGNPCALLTIIETEGSTPRGVGSKMVVNLEGKTDGTVGGGVVEDVCLREVPRVIQENRSLVLRFSLAGDEWKVTEERTIQGLCGGRVGVLIEPVLPAKEIVIFGGGHIADKLAKLCDVCAIPYRVFDNRPEFTSAERFPGARDRVCAPYEELSSRIALTAHSYCVIMTHGHAHDEICLEALTKDPQLPYIGMIGSANKVKVVFGNIRSRGGMIDDRVHSPVGLRLGGKLPEEVALSILAEIELRMSDGSATHRRISAQGP